MLKNTMWITVGIFICAALMLPALVAEGEKYENALKVQQEQFEAERDRLQHSTILEDFAPVNGLPGAPNGSLLIQPAENYKLLGNSIPRWLVPGRVVPKVYGDSSYARFYYVGPGAKVEGPYAPAQAVATAPTPSPSIRFAPRPYAADGGALWCFAETPPRSSNWRPRADGMCYAEDNPWRHLP